jgi:hypothetical protein
MSANSNTHCGIRGMYCSVVCPRCHEVSLLDNRGEVYICALNWLEVVPTEIDTTPGEGQ